MNFDPFILRKRISWIKKGYFITFVSPPNSINRLTFKYQKVFLKMSKTNNYPDWHAIHKRNTPNMYVRQIKQYVIFPSRTKKIFKGNLSSKKFQNRIIFQCLSTTRPNGMIQDSQINSYGKMLTKSQQNPGSFTLIASPSLILKLIPNEFHYIVHVIYTTIQQFFIQQNTSENNVKNLQKDTLRIVRKRSQVHKLHTS